MAAGAPDGARTVALVRPEDVTVAREEVLGRIAAGDHDAAERAMARYEPASQALIVRDAFASALAADGSETEAARRAERVVDAIPEDHASAAVAALDDGLLGVMLGAAAGEHTSSIAELVDPDRFERLLAHDLELWTVTDERMGPRRSRLNSPQLVRLVWTALQVEDARASAILAHMNPDFIALPLAEELSDPSRAEEETDEDSDVAFTPLERLRVLHADGPAALALTMELAQLLDRVYALDPDRYSAILDRASALDAEAIRAVRGDLERAARERAVGEEGLPTGVEGADDAFAPLDAALDDKG